MPSETDLLIKWLSDTILLVTWQKLLIYFKIQLGKVFCIYNSIKILFVTGFVQTFQHECTNGFNGLIVMCLRSLVQDEYFISVNNLISRTWPDRWDFPLLADYHFRYNKWASFYLTGKKFDDIFSRLDTIHQRDRQTDGRTPGDSKHRAYA